MATDKEKTTNTEISEPGRKTESTPEQHLQFLLGLGWAPESVLIQRYLRKHNICLPKRQKI